MTPELSAAILGAVARTRVEADLPAAILAAIRATHVVIERERWERVRSFAVREFAENYTDVDDWRNDRNAKLQLGDLDEA